MYIAVYVHGSVALKKINYVFLSLFRTLFFLEECFPVEAEFSRFSVDFRLKMDVTKTGNRE